MAGSPVVSISLIGFCPGWVVAPLCSISPVCASCKICPLWCCPLGGDGGLSEEPKLFDMVLIGVRSGEVRVEDTYPSNLFDEGEGEGERERKCRGGMYLSR